MNSTLSELSQTPAAPLRYLDDLQVGDRFSSAGFLLDEAQIKAFALQFDPQPFHLDHEAAKETLFGGLAASGWHTAAITMRLLVGGGLPLAAKSAGPSPHGPAICCRLNPKWSASRPRVRGRNAAWWWCAAQRKTSTAMCCSFRSTSSWYRASRDDASELNTQMAGWGRRSMPCRRWFCRYA